MRGRKGLRLGIMGGAFDPIHIAHLVTAEEALIQFRLDEIVFMPAGNHPFKARRLAPAEFRYLLVAMATASHPHFLVSRYELDQVGVTYTANTLEFLADTLGPDAELFFVTGADAVLDILAWKDPERVLELCTLIAATRPGYDLARLAEALEHLTTGGGSAGTGARVKFMEVPALAISSSMIRDRLYSGKAARYLLPDCVAELVEKAGYYSHASNGPDGSVPPNS
ncbi:MAG TPA: nicotinate-nucleotide adenylyltransferase [Thermoleophilia bacterium]|nr:nicotinate-nucleotide adenylyltransferase [Thermoleophilia bacterium]